MSKTLEQKLEEIQAKIDAVDAEIAPLEKKRSRFFNQRERIKQQLRDANKLDLQYVLNDINAFKELQALLPDQLKTGGYYPETMEQAIELKLNYKAEIQQETLDFIERWLNITKRKIIGVFRYDLCSYGKWEVAQREDGVWIVYDRRTMRYRKHAEFEGTLKAALEYVSEHHWYEGGETNEYDEDGF